MANPWDIVDILLVAFLFYKLMRFMRNTNAQKLFQGLILLVCGRRMRVRKVLPEMETAAFLLPMKEPSAVWN